MTKVTQASDATQAAHDIQQLQHNLRVEIVYRRLDEIQDYKRGLRKRSRRWRTAMEASIRRFGLILPILIDQHGTIIGGEGVFEVAKGCGFDEVPTVRIDQLDETDVRLLRLALDRIGEESGWDKIELTEEWRELQPTLSDVMHRLVIRAG